MGCRGPSAARSPPRPDQVVRDRLPDAQRERAALLELLPEPQCAEPAVLVVHRGDAARVRELDAGAHRVEVRVVGHEHVPLLEPPGGLLAEHARRLAVRVALDDAARHLEVAARERERGGVEPERVVVACAISAAGVSPLSASRSAASARGRLPVAAPPAVAAQPAPVGPRRAAGAVERLGERRAAVELDLALRERPRREVHVRVGEPGNDDAAAQVDHLRRGERRLVHADAAGDPVAGDRERALRRHRRVERADEAVLEDHSRNLRRGGTGGLSDVPRITRCLPIARIAAGRWSPSA